MHDAILSVVKFDFTQRIRSLINVLVGARFGHLKVSGMTP